MNSNIQIQTFIITTSIEKNERKMFVIIFKLISYCGLRDATLASPLISLFYSRACTPFKLYIAEVLRPSAVLWLIDRQINRSHQLIAEFGRLFKVSKPTPYIVARFQRFQRRFEVSKARIYLKYLLPLFRSNKLWTW